MKTTSIDNSYPLVPIEKHPQIWVSGISYRDSDIAWRESLAIGGEERVTVLRQLSGLVDEVVLLSTCNRTEVYAVGSTSEIGEAAVVSILAEFSGYTEHAVRQRLYTYRQERAVRHLFAVATGLDSLVIGEDQILGQVKEALEVALECGSVGRILSQLFRDSISVGKTVRSQTELGRRHGSVSKAAVELISEAFGPAKPSGVLVIGAGKTAALAVQALFKEGIGPVLVTNRTYEAAYELTKKMGGDAIAFDDISTALAATDVVISATAAPHLVVRRSMVEPTLASRAGRPLYMVDIAVPRDIEPAVGELDGVRLYDIDDLQSVVADDLGLGQEEADKVWLLVTEKARQFNGWLRSLDAVPTIVALREQAEQIRQEELQHMSPKLALLTDEERRAVDILTSSIVNRLLHQPTVELKKGDNGMSMEERLRAVRMLFNLSASRPR